ncbi:MAG: response regulator [Steroidobacteraceae bacterium]|jgi:CheY-like chemotaxis protein
MNASQVTILLVEDDDIDAQTVMRGLASAKIVNPVVRVRDGVEALELLQGTGGKKRLAPPYLLLVDIRMPRLDGLGLVRAIRNNASLQRTIVFILTTSDSDVDRMNVYNEHVAGYIVKTNSPDQFLRLARMLEYYIMIVALPPTAVA